MSQDGTVHVIDSDSDMELSGVQGLEEIFQTMWELDRYVEQASQSIF